MNLEYLSPLALERLFDSCQDAKKESDNPAERYELSRMQNELSKMHYNLTGQSLEVKKFVSIK